jgi:uncharacterized spore protein YtfJ
VRCGTAILGESVGIEGDRGTAVKLEQLLSTAGESMTVKRVFANPYEKDGITIIPGAVVSGGGGGGTGHDDKGQEGEGGGFGMMARPAGAYVIKDGRVRWRSAVDLNRLAVVAGMVAMVWLLTRRQMRHR